MPFRIANPKERGSKLYKININVEYQIFQIFKIWEISF